MCRPEYLQVVCSLCGKNLGIASAGAAGLKELTQSFSGQGKPMILLGSAGLSRRFAFLAPRGARKATF